MFDFERAVEDWKSEIGRGGVVAGADMEELESHLRESADRLMAAGLSAEEAFLLAVRRLGGADPLRLEYGKAHPERVWRERAAWMFVGLLAWGAIISVSEIVGRAGLMGAAMVGVRGGMLGGAAVLTNVVSLALTVMLAAVMYRRVRDGRMGVRPVAWIVAGVLAMIVGRMAGQVEAAGIAYLVGPSDLGSMVLIQAYYGLAQSLLMPVAFGVLAVRLRRKPVGADC